VLRIGSVVFRVDDLERQAAFWTAALDYFRADDGSSGDWAFLKPKDGEGPNVALSALPSMLPVPPRIHLDLYTEDQAEEIRRLKALGATHPHEENRPPDADYVILADPEGNRFCVVDITA
jgi:predicted enzyme related to lactoylglutathione lyase